VLHFPAGRNLGLLWIRRRGRNHGWEPIAEARGEVHVPAGPLLKLESDPWRRYDLVWVSALRSNVLDVVDLGQISVDDAEVAHLLGLTGLQALLLGQAALTDLGLSYVARLRHLSVLDLSGTQISDAGLVHLAALRSLEVLDLRGCAVTDAGLRHLAAIPSLRLVVLTGCPISHAGQERLQAELPLCNVNNTTALGVSGWWG
jgi:hypothetical protein